MVALLPHRHEAEAPKPKACTSDSYYWVVTDGGAQRAVCGPHLHLMLGQMLIEHPHIASEDPAPGTRCEYLEVQRVTKYAALVRTIPTQFGDVRLYRLSEPLRGFTYVTVSAVRNIDRPETYIFGSDADGSAACSSELPGSYKGGLSHEEALKGAGYVAEVPR